MPEGSGTLFNNLTTISRGRQGAVKKSFGRPGEIGSSKLHGVNKKAPQYHLPELPQRNGLRIPQAEITEFVMSRKEGSW